MPTYSSDLESGLGSKPNYIYTNYDQKIYSSTEKGTKTQLPQPHQQHLLNYCSARYTEIPSDSIPKALIVSFDPDFHWQKELTPSFEREAFSCQYDVKKFQDTRSKRKGLDNTKILLPKEKEQYKDQAPLYSLYIDKIEDSLPLTIFSNTDNKKFCLTEVNFHQPLSFTDSEKNRFSKLYQTIEAIIVSTPLDHSANQFSHALNRFNLYTDIENTRWVTKLLGISLGIISFCGITLYDSLMKQIYPTHSFTILSRSILEPIKYCSNHYSWSKLEPNVISVTILSLSCLPLVIFLSMIMIFWLLSTLRQNRH